MLISDIKILSGEESQQEGSVHQLFEEQVKRTPDAVAAVFADRQITYRELNKQANQLAHYLQKLGVGPEVMVGICLERSLDMVVGILGILKAGGAYVPLDPAYPKERLAFMLADTRLSVLLTEKQWMQALPEFEGTAVCLDEAREEIARENQENPASGVTPQNLAYIIYTSGSTGKPKGVQMPHASVWHYIQEIDKVLRVNGSDVYLHMASFSFTASVRQLILPLSRGATCVIATREQTRTPLSLFELIQKQGVTVSDGVPSVWRYGLMALESIDKGHSLSQSKLRMIVFGGELLPCQLLQKLRNIFKNQLRFFNILGQTESIGHGFYAIPEDFNQEQGNVPVGSCLERAQQVYILDTNLQPVREGELGEIHVAGLTLARGYLNRPEETAEKFGLNPFNPQQRLFKTGDVGRYLPDGNLEIVGRIDFQVNIRGMRVELGEIESALGLHASVKEAAVTGREDVPGDKRIVAYIVPKLASEDSAPAVDMAELRSFLNQKLPDYMVPSAFVLMEALPLLPNGKLNRNGLPAPDLSSYQRNFVAPRSQTEIEIAAIWAEVLGLEKVGIYDNFLELGGHSLLGSLVISRLNEAFSVQFPVTALFESPTVAGLSDRLSTAVRQNPSQQIPALQPVERSGKLPLSLTQQRLWFVDQLEGANAAFNITRAVRLVGPLKVGVLEQAIGAIIERHETLRTSFKTVRGEPVQVIASPQPFTLPVVDLQGWPEVERSAETLRLVTEEYSRPFDLAAGPLLRVTLIRLESESHVLTVTKHHIISDAWSVGIFFKDLSAFYAALSGETAPQLAELPVQYADFAYWQRQYISKEAVETQLNYWKEQLAGAPPFTELPADRPRSSTQSFEGSIHRFELSSELTQQLKALSQKSGATLYMTLLAAFVILLSRYSGQEDIVVGSPITNRNRRALEALIGFFVNTLVLRTKLQGNPTFLELLGRVRQIALDGYAHQDVPFDLLVETLQPARHSNHSPLFSVMFVLQNSPVEQLELAGVKAIPVELDRPTAGATFDLTLSLQETEWGLRGAFEYNAQLFDATTVQRMVRHFETLVGAIATHPESRIAQLPVLTAAEQHQILVEWNKTQTNYPAGECLHQVFERQVRNAPDAVAVVLASGESAGAGEVQKQLTYRELNARANQFARYLRSVGVAPETLVGICLEKTPDLIVALLGILKAGGAYLPLDPTYPSERLGFMVQDAQVPVLVTQQQLLGKVPQTGARVICLDADWSVIGIESRENLECNTTAENLVYVMYTSGSTGLPKGVMIPHRAVMRLVVSTDYVSWRPKDAVAQVSNISFDAATFEIWGALLNGAKLVIFPKEKVLSLGDFASSLLIEGITVLLLSPALFNQMVQEVPSAFQSLRFLLLGGEALDPSRVRQALESGAPQQLLNVYGPTENATISTWYRVEEVEPGAGTVPIGKAIANSQTYILDRHLQPVPVGVAGELYVGGAGLALGYLNRPALTAEKFIANPFAGGEPHSERLYRTGDLARYLPDGNIEFLGRIDSQVKIRGFRIELGEIEAALNQHPNVKQAAVIVREDHPGNKVLVGYVVPQTETPSGSELRSFIQPKLPEYMVPAAFVMLDALPLTPNGKVDRRALPAPDIELIREKQFVAPRTPTEEVIANILGAVLGLERVSLDDNFFELGGHSLLAIQVISRLQEAFQTSLPLRCLFEAPTVAELAREISAQRQTDSRQLPPAIAPVSKDKTEFPLSFAQARLWFPNQLEGQSATYSMSFAVRITGNLDVNALERAVQEIVRRHAILRTNFKAVSGSTVQVIKATATPALSAEIVRDLPPDEGELRRTATLEAQKPFDLATESLLRVKLLQFSERDHLFLLTVHHIVADGWSVGILLQELSALYQAFSEGNPSPLPELAIQYADFAVWQQQWLSAGVLDTQLNYWKQQLAGAPPLLELPSDRPRQAVQTFRGSNVLFEIDPQIAQELKTLSQRSGVTLFMTLLAAYATLLFRYSGQEDIPIGCPVANRHYRETEPLIGFFVNTLVLRTQLQGNPSFSELLDRVRQVALLAYANQDAPFERVVEALQPERSLSHSPLFQVMFDLQHEPPQWELPGLSLTPVKKEHFMAKFDLTLTVETTSAGLRGEWEYSSDLFNRETVARMSSQFQTLLAAIVANPDQTVGELPLLAERERYQMLVEWNSTQQDCPLDRCLHEVFERQVEQTPDAVAVEFAGESLTYRELNERANQLARYLQSLDVEPEALVGLCLERSPALIVALLGILKAGGAYLPLDPTYPSERLGFMVQDAQVPVLVTQQQLLGKVPQTGARVICLDADWSVIGIESRENLECNTTAENLVYVMYTSGSTGLPKGVMIPHRAVMRLVVSTDYVSWRPKDAVAQVSNISFDAATFEIWGALLNGAKLVIFPKEKVLSLGDFASSLLIEGITVLLLSPALFNQMVQEVPSAFQSLRFLLLGGEALDPSRVRQALESGAPQQLLNVYGPTENATISTWYRVEEVEPGAGTVPIGKAIANSQTYILDRHLQPVPVGVAGELYVGGAGLALGYLNRPALTAEKFIANPFAGGEPHSERLYRTGDLARYLPDGNIEFLGRIDSQVKIRGFRIELGEIEAVLSQHPNVKQAAVIVREDHPGNKVLVGYFVPQTETPSGSELRSFLQQKLADYMVPATFVMLEDIPLTPNGKVNRRALPEPNLDLDRETDFVAPRTPVEEIIAGIMATVLGVGRIGTHDNFFALGGHSLLATQVISRLRETLQVELPLRCLFEFPTVAELEKAIATYRQQGAESLAPAIKPLPRGTQTFPLSLAEERLWFIDQLEGQSATYNMAFSFQISGKLNVPAFQQAVAEIVRRHEGLRTRFVTVGDSPVQQIDSNPTFTVSAVDLQQVPEKERAAQMQHLAKAEASKPFDLSGDRLLRVTLVQLEPEKHFLLLVMHHIVSDGWSVQIFKQELSALYTAFSSNTPSPLPDLPIQYADFAVWQRQWLSEQVCETQLNYWKQQLAGIPPLLELPADRPRPARQSFRGGKVSFKLDLELTQQLSALSQKSGTTLFMTLLAAWATLLLRYSGQEDIVVGSPIANRTSRETESLIGFFVNTLVLRLPLQDNPSFVALLKRVRQVAIEAYAHQDVPFQQVVEALQIQRNLSHTPIFQVMFDLDRDLLMQSELPGLTLTPVLVEQVTAIFDLSLSMKETPEGLRGYWEYNSDLFDRETIARWSGHFQTLLARIVANPDCSVGELPLLTDGERNQLLGEWNSTQADCPSPQCVHQLFEAQVQKTPLSVAVEFAGESLTYRELNERANQLAHHLQGLGVGPEVLVGICLERSIEMIVGILGILKAGGAYVPLDPSYPQERLAYILSDSQISLLLTQEKLIAGLPLSGATVVCLQRDWAAIAKNSPTEPHANVQPENLAYVIYTSGSTGQPKGVLIEHRALANFTQGAIDVYQINQPDRVLQFASLSFDVAAEEIYPCLSVGGTLVLRTDEMLRDAATFVRDCADWEITVLNLPTAYWQQLMSELAAGALTFPSSLRLVIIGSEQVTAEICRMWQKCTAGLPQAPKFINGYGPTETTVTVTTCDLSEWIAKNPESPVVPIGRPVGKVRVCVLDRNQQLVPIGIPGELHIGGATLARGYHNRPELTAEKFIPNIAVQSTSDRLYKTGDIVRYLADGNLEFIGRTDSQVKIRGFRIELGEIEAALGQHPDVREVAVVCREDTPGNKRLIAYVVSNQSAAYLLDTQEKWKTLQRKLSGSLRDYLKQKLPDYMVPSAFVLMEALPLTPNGKVDRRALPAPDLRPELDGSFVAPRTAIEEKLACIWAEVLNLELVGINDNFFELGGHSLKATQLMSQLRAAFKIELPLRQLFENPTVAELAATIASTAQNPATITAHTHWDLNAEAVLDPTIHSRGVPFTDTSEPKSILLTGASGFFGTYLLYELLEQTQADIYCLIRSANEKQAVQKLSRQMASFHLWKEAFSSRIVPVVGDLSKTLLGLSAARFQEFAIQIDAIYHNAAWVNALYPYSTLKPANVLGTQEVLRLASEIKLKPVHYISTLSVFSAPAYYEMKSVDESDLLDHSPDINNGYAASKWVAEKLVMNARDRGLPVCIYRPSRILGHSQTGICNPDDFLSKFIPGCIQLGMVPKLDFWVENIIPADYMSRAIIHLSRQKECLGQAFHLVNPNSTPLNELFNWIRDLGYPVEEVSYKEWRSHLIRTNQVSSSEVLQSLLPIFSEKNMEAAKKPPEFDFTNVLSGLAGTDIAFPPVERGLIEKYVSDFTRRNFIPKPTL
jgi:amino acid adenylation domain-containing protein/thioester reductase-like protein